MIFLQNGCLLIILWGKEPLKYPNWKKVKIKSNATTTLVCCVSRDYGSVFWNWVQMKILFLHSNTAQYWVCSILMGMWINVHKNFRRKKLLCLTSHILTKWLPLWSCFRICCKIQRAVVFSTENWTPYFAHVALIESDAEGIGGSGFIECIREHLYSVSVATVWHIYTVPVLLSWTLLYSGFISCRAGMVDWPRSSSLRSKNW